MTNSNNVNHPSHYNTNGIECIDAMVAAFGVEDVKTFCKLNAFKYLWRSKHKGHDLEDVEKAIWYEKYFLKLSEKNDNGRDGTIIDG